MSQALRLSMSTLTQQGTQGGFAGQAGVGPEGKVWSWQLPRADPQCCCISIFCQAPSVPLALMACPNKPTWCFLTSLTLLPLDFIPFHVAAFPPESLSDWQSVPTALLPSVIMHFLALHSPSHSFFSAVGGKVRQLGWVRAGPWCTGSYSPGRGEGGVWQGLQRGGDVLQVFLLSRKHHSSAAGGVGVQRAPSVAVCARTEGKLGFEQL